MGRKLKRVPLDFDHPMGEIWEGYLPPISKLQGLFSSILPEVMNYQAPEDICKKCKCVECTEEYELCLWSNKELRKKWYYEPPLGEGFQLWETTTEGSPQSPVFKTLDELCEWCEDNATTFASQKTTKEEWMLMLTTNYVYHQEGNVIFF